MNRNKDKCKILYNGNEYQLVNDLPLDNDTREIEIILKGISNITNMSEMFSYCSSLLSLYDISNCNISKVTNMKEMFYDCTSLKSLSGISNWDTSNVTNMKGMFNGCYSLVPLPDISKWNTSNVENMEFMFRNCSLLKSLPNISNCDGSLFLSIPEFIVFSTDDILPSIYDLITILSDALFLILTKYTIQKYYISPLKLSIFFGIISIIIHCIGFVVYSLIIYHDLSYYKNCFESSDENNSIISLYFIGTFIFAIIHNILLLSSIFYFSPNLIIITGIITPIIYWIFNIITSDIKLPEAVLQPIGLIICLFSSLIYNEIIILNFFGFSKSTKKFVGERTIRELQEIQKDEEKILDDDDIPKTFTNDYDLSLK